MDLKGKRALVTGGTLGIGAAIAHDLVKSGARVCINARNDNKEAHAVREALERHGLPCNLLVGDLALQPEAERCVNEAIECMDGLDILVHNAGGPAFGKIEDVSDQIWRHAFDVHVHAAFYTCRKALPAMRKAGGGAIILVSSVAGIRGVPGAIAYATAKGAVVQFTRCLARDVADDNIRVNCVAPGVIRTRFHEKMTDEQKAHNIANRIPLHREGTTDDVAQAVHLLLTNEFMTGETIVVDGGMSMQVTR